MVENLNRLSEPIQNQIIGVVGLALCFVEENLKANRFRSLIDMSVKKETRSGPAVLHQEDEPVKKIIDMDLHANNFKDGVFGSLRHCVVKDGI